MKQLESYFTNCTLCPRKCMADRTGRPGFCGCTSKLKAARAGLHYFEEPFLSGIKGSGTVFFTGCNLQCVYCQNSAIARAGAFGKELSIERLSQIFLEQQERGAHNINLVTGTPYIPYIAKALENVRNSNELEIPVIWNSSGYEDVETLKLLDGLIDIYLPDFKTLSSELALRYMNAPDYPQKSKECLEHMVKVTGKAEFVELGNDKSHPANDDDIRNLNMPKYDKEDIEECGIMVKGVCVRHLVIPGRIEDSKNVLSYLYETYGDEIWISLMSQYTPMRNDFSAQELNRKITIEEYDDVVDYAIDLGVEQCMIQEGDVSQESFIPIFDGAGI